MSTPRRRHRLAIVVGVVAVVAAAAWGVASSPLLDVDQVSVRGAQQVSVSDIESAAGVHPGDAMVWIDTAQAADRIEALPYVRSATVVREWPDTVRVTVRERRPVAWVDGPAGKALVDETGRVLEIVETPPPAVPELRGARVVPRPGGEVDALGATRVAGALDALAAAGTASVELTEQGVVLHLVTGQEIRMGPATRVAVKLRAAYAVLGATQDQPVAYVDVSVPTNPVTG